MGDARARPPRVGGSGTHTHRWLPLGVAIAITASCGSASQTRPPRPETEPRASRPETEPRASHSATEILASLSPITRHEAPPGYPVSWPVLEPTAREERAKAFRARNPGFWDRVVVEEHGFVSKVTTDDSSVLPIIRNSPDLPQECAERDAERRRRFVVKNADLFGVAPSLADHVSCSTGLEMDTLSTGHGSSILLQGVQFIGLDVDVHLGPFAVAPTTPLVSDDEAIAAVVPGLVDEYRDVATYREAGGIDCGMSPAGEAGCWGKTLGDVEARLTLSRADVEVMTLLHRERRVAGVRTLDEFRIVKCVTLKWGRLVHVPPPRAEWSPQLAPGLAPPSGSPLRSPAVAHRAFVSVDGTPTLPAVVDAITGELLHFESFEDKTGHAHNGPGGCADLGWR
jgi:hypothetical protein